MRRPEFLIAYAFFTGAHMSTGILLVNLGTPDSPEVPDVRRFLREFLMDPLVVDLPLLPRWLLVNLIIAPFRSPKSAKEYQGLWTPEGSPLKVHTKAVAEKLTARIGEQYHLAWGMRYQNPSIRVALEELKASGCDEILLLPLFPQYAEATTLSVFHETEEQLKAMGWDVAVKKIHSFPTDERFISAIIEQSKSVALGDADHILFSYHGLPERQLKKLNIGCLEDNCCAELTEHNYGCYRAQCYATTRALAEQLGLNEADYTVCFQSRQGNIPWIQPYTEDVIEEQANRGAKRLVVFSPAFVADCLETTMEIAHGYRQDFIDMGGEELELVPGLNSSEPWIDALENLINKELAHEAA